MPAARRRGAPIATRTTIRRRVPADVRARAAVRAVPIGAVPVRSGALAEAGETLARKRGRAAGHLSGAIHRGSGRVDRRSRLAVSGSRGCMTRTRGREGCRPGAVRHR